MSFTGVRIETVPEPTVADLDGIISQLEASWTSRITVRRDVREDIGIRDIYVSLDGESLAILLPGQDVSREVPPGSHRLRVHNTLFWKTIDFTVTVGEHVSFVVSNRRGFGTYSFFAYLIGCNVIYLKVEREAIPGHRR
jgi:hypothetical protein